MLLRFFKRVQMITDMHSATVLQQKLEEDLQRDIDYHQEVAFLSGKLEGMRTMEQESRFYHERPVEQIEHYYHQQDMSRRDGFPPPYRVVAGDSHESYNPAVGHGHRLYHRRMRAYQIGLR